MPGIAIEAGRGPGSAFGCVANAQAAGRDAAASECASGKRSDLDGRVAIEGFAHQERFVDARRDQSGSRWSRPCRGFGRRSEEHTSELQSLMRNSYAVFCLKKKKELKKADES